jgi:Holliday junction resolvase RusA-like endonuclease
VNIELPDPAVRLVIFGIPAPKGSKTAFPFRRPGGGLGVKVTEGKGGTALPTWLGQVHTAVQATAAGGAPMLDGPLVAWVAFWLPKPKSAPKRRRIWPDRKPDLDKLLRALLDPLTGVLIADDARIVRFSRLEKLYAENGEAPRAEIMLWRAEDLEPQLMGA